MEGGSGAQAGNGKPPAGQAATNGHAAADPDSEIAPIVFAFLERRSESIEKLCKRVIRGAYAFRGRNPLVYGEQVGNGRSENAPDAFPLDEALSECTLRAFDAVRTYDASKGTELDTHIFGTLRLYLTKLIYTRTPVREAWRKEQLLQRATESQFIINSNDQIRLEQLEQIQFVWDNLPEDDAALLELRFINECSLEEIAEVFECSTSKVCGMIQRALQVAKQMYESKRS